MQRLLAITFVCFLLFSTLWARPIPKRFSGKNMLMRQVINRAYKGAALNFGGAITCDGCQLVIAWAENELAKNSTEAEIETFLNTTLCDAIPSVVRAECENIVDAYFPELVALILSRENPTTACTQIKLCSSTNQK